MRLLRSGHGIEPGNRLDLLHGDYDARLPELLLFRVLSLTPVDLANLAIGGIGHLYDVCEQITSNTTRMIVA